MKSHLGRFYMFDPRSPEGQLRLCAHAATRLGLVPQSAESGDPILADALGDDPGTKNAFVDISQRIHDLLGSPDSEGVQPERLQDWVAKAEAQLARFAPEDPANWDLAAFWSGVVASLAHTLGQTDRAVDAHNHASALYGRLGWRGLAQKHHALARELQSEVHG